MVFRRVATVSAGIARPLYHWQEVAVLRVVQHFGQRSRQPELMAFVTDVADTLEGGVVFLVDELLSHGAPLQSRVARAKHRDVAQQGFDVLLYWPQFSERAACCLLYRVGRQDDLALGQPVEQHPLAHGAPRQRCDAAFALGGAQPVIEPAGIHHPVTAIQHDVRAHCMAQEIAHR